MPIKSYAQNFEDVLLWRALGEVENGFYVDIGAMDPTMDSVSKLFHEKGWKGIHVDANPAFCEKLRRERSGDVIVQAAIGSTRGVIDFFVVSDTGISTAVKELANQHERAGWRVESVRVPMVTLDDVMEGFEQQDVHWLKIDVEGFERAVLDGWQGSYRPWIVIIEAIAPFTRDSTRHLFEDAILDKGYVFSYFDGINCYYILNDHSNLLTFFEYGPAIWDEIKLTRSSPMVEHVVQDEERRTDIIRSEKENLEGRLSVISGQYEELKLNFSEANSLLTTSEIHNNDLRALNEILNHKCEELENLTSRLQDDLTIEKDRVVLLTHGQASESLDQLLVEGDREFLQSAYLTLFGRPIDDVGMQYYMDRLSAGESKGDILSNLYHSVEREQFNPIVPGLRRLARRRGLGAVATRWAGHFGYRRASTAAIEQVRALFLLPPDKFIAKAYNLILGREPDSAGMQHFMHRLSLGDARIDILAALRWSGEGRARISMPSGIEAATAWARWRHFGWIRRFIHSRASTIFLSSRTDRLTSVFDKLTRLEDDAETIGYSQASMARPSIRALRTRLDLMEKSFHDGTPLLRPEGNAGFGVSGSERDQFGRHPDDELPSNPSNAPEPDQRLAMAEELVRGLSLDKAGGEFAVEIKCSSEMPRDEDSRSQWIWYAVGAEFRNEQVLPAIPDQLSLIATEDAESAKNAVDLGIGIPAINVGMLEPGGQRNPGKQKQIGRRLSACAQQLISSAGISSGIDDRFRLAILTTWNERCGIFTHSAELAEAFQGADVRIYASKQDNKVSEDGPNVRRLWTSSKQANDLGNVTADLNKSPVDLLIVQFNYAFYNHAELDRLMIDVADLGMVVMIILHSTANDGSEPNWRIADFQAGLQRCGRVIVHSSKDVDWLACIGVKDNVILLPHGVKVGARASVNPVQNATPILATFGFCFPNKGLVEFIEAVALLRDRGFMVRARMLNALHPSLRSRETLDKMRDAVHQRDLGSQIQIVPEFLELDKVEALISTAHLFVNPYHDTGESASGSVRLGLRMGLPTLVTPLPLFDDLKGAVFRASGVSAEDVADSIQATLEHLHKNSAEAQAVQSALSDWLSRHDFRLQTERLKKICRSLQYTKFF